jgi:hypothetical protein
MTGMLALDRTDDSAWSGRLRDRGRGQRARNCAGQAGRDALAASPRGALLAPRPGSALVHLRAGQAAAPAG